MFPEEVDGEPKLEIIEHPKSRGFRFRYTCEGPSHGGIPGASSDKNKKTFPAVKIVNYQGYARIVVQLVTNEENPRLHPHSLVGKQCQNGICTVQCGPKDMTATFPNLGIQHVTKKNVASILEERYIAAEMQLSSINDGFPQEVQRNIKDEDKKRIAAKAQSEAKSIDLSVVRLMFIAYLPDSQGAFTIMLKPIISNAIFDSKAPNAATLKICRMDCNAGSASGGDEVYLLCDKVQKDDIQVRFVEEDAQGVEVWEGYGNFCPTDVHRQFAIVFRTPPYKDQFIGQPVNVNVQLRRKSDQEVSEPRSFTYLPNKTDFDLIERKRRKVVPDYLDHLEGNNTHGYNFSSGASGNSVPGGFQFDSSSGSSNDNVKKTTLCSSQPVNPQDGPIDPSRLFATRCIQARNGSVKMERPPSNASCYSSQIPSTSAFPTSHIDKPARSDAKQPIENCITNLQDLQDHFKFNFLSDEMPPGVLAQIVVASSQTTEAGNNTSSTITGSDVTTMATAPVTSQPNVMSPVDMMSPIDVMSQPTSFFDVTLQPSANELLDDVMEYIDENDLETDGRKAEASSVEYYDFASVWDGGPVIGTPVEEVPDTIASTNKVEEDDEMDTTLLSLKLDELDLNVHSCDDSDHEVVEQQLKEIATEAESSDLPNDVIETDSPVSMVTEESSDVITAMQEYSITGDVRSLLRLQLHTVLVSNQQGDTLLHLAVTHGQFEVLCSILDVVSGMDNSDDVLNCTNIYQQTALHIATLAGDVSSVIKLLKTGADPLIPDRNGNNAVHVASRCGDADILSRLLRSKQICDRNVDTKNNKGFTAYHLAVKASRNTQQCLKILRDSHCDVNCCGGKRGKSPLYIAVETQHHTAVRCLVKECGADVKLASASGSTPLHVAAANGYHDTALLLLAHGADAEASYSSNQDEQITPMSLTTCAKMRDILEGKHSLEETNDKDETDTDFSPTWLHKLHALLDCKQSCSNWFELAERLQLPFSEFLLSATDSPTESLLKTFWARHGTVDGLRSALMNIGRHDAVQVLNQAVTCQDNAIY